MDKKYPTFSSINVISEKESLNIEIKRYDLSLSLSLSLSLTITHSKSGI
jgi:hypothetical protein